MAGGSNGRSCRCNRCPCGRPVGLRRRSTMRTVCPEAVDTACWAATVCTSRANERDQSAQRRRPSWAGMILRAWVPPGTGRMWSVDGSRAADRTDSQPERRGSMNCHKTAAAAAGTGLSVSRKNCTTADRTCLSLASLSRTSPAFPVFYTQTCCYLLHQNVVHATTE